MTTDRPSLVDVTDPDEPDDACAHGCGGYATIQHADGRVLCRPCYAAETGNAERLGCPTCGGASAS